MDILPSQVNGQECVRDLLIAISEGLPDNILGSNGLPVEKSAATENGQTVGSNTEDYRSKLISISYILSPDVTRPQPLVQKNDA